MAINNQYLQTALSTTPHLNRPPRVMERLRGMIVVMMLIIFTIALMAIATETMTSTDLQTTSERCVIYAENGNCSYYRNVPTEVSDAEQIAMSAFSALAAIFMFAGAVRITLQGFLMLPDSDEDEAI